MSLQGHNLDSKKQKHQNLFTLLVFSAFCGLLRENFKEVIQWGDNKLTRMSVSRFPNAFSRYLISRFYNWNNSGRCRTSVEADTCMLVSTSRASTSSQMLHLPARTETNTSHDYLFNQTVDRISLVWQATVKKWKMAALNWTSTINMFYSSQQLILVWAWMTRANLKRWS